MKTKLLTLLIAILAIQDNHAATIFTLDLAAGDDSSARIRDTGSFDGLGDLAQTEQNNFVGTITFGGNGAAVNTAFAFEMTGAINGGSIYAADFSVNLDVIGGSPSFNVDVYANRVNADGTILKSDYENGTLIMADFVTTTDVVGSYSLDATGEANLLTYMQDNWVEGSYVFLSLKADPVQTSFPIANNNYRFGGSSTSTAQIQLAAPEPSSTALLGLGGLALMLRRKRSAA